MFLLTLLAEFLSPQILALVSNFQKLIQSIALLPLHIGVSLKVDTGLNACVSVKEEWTSRCLV